MMARLENVLRAIERDAKIRMLFIEFRDHHHARHHELIRIGPGFFGLHFDAFDAINHHDGAIGDAQGRPRVRHERGVSRRVYKINFGISDVRDGRVRY